MIKIKDVDKLRKGIVLKGLSYTALANKIGVSKTLIGSIFTGKRNPSPAVAIKICQELGNQFDDYFFIESVHKKEQKGD